MKLDIIESCDTFDEICEYIKIYFESDVRIDRIDLSIFEQYRMYPKEKFIPKLWSYRIIAKNGQYHFGTI